MWLKSITIKNFRALEDIRVEFDRRANVVVGPNATGKTTILEAIRLAKSILAPRTQQEQTQTLISLGIISPHLPQQINFPALIRNLEKPMIISADYRIHDSEVEVLPSLLPSIARAMVQASLGQPSNNPLDLINFLSSDHGRSSFADAQNKAAFAIAAISNKRECLLELNANAATTSIVGADQLSQIIFSELEKRLEPYSTQFSYFPADRAMPPGEVQIQLGGADAAAALEAHNSQPQTKYNRLKPTIISSIVINNQRSTDLKDEIETVLSKLMRNKELDKIESTHYGMLQIKMRDKESNQLFDIDGMSSGEKGLLMLFIVIARTVAIGGLILLDEPELHLNPAVCKLLLPFLIDHYLTPKNIQAIICSHSPEILSVAFDRPDCTLFHLQSNTVISPIYPDDKKEVFDALRRLGASTSDILFFRGSIFVEGEHDAEILLAGIPDIIGRYKITGLGGRSNVEREINELQAAERRHELDSLSCFIFDLDSKPSSLSSTKLVRVLQWKRRCIENYLIDEKAIFDVLSNEKIASIRIDRRGEVQSIFREIAMAQLPYVVATEVYTSYGYENSGLRAKELKGKTTEEMASCLIARLSMIKSQLLAVEPSAWTSEFLEKCAFQQSIKEVEWQSDWPRLCDGKKFFAELQSRYKVRISPLQFKTSIIEAMKKNSSEGLSLLKEQVETVLS